jgi:Integrase core domain
VIIAWINHYNAVRRHSSLGNVPPIEWELRYYRSIMVEAAWIPSPQIAQKAPKPIGALQPLGESKD